MRIKRPSLVALVVLSFLAGAAVLQVEAAPTGSVSGVVRDTNGAPLAGAALTLLEGGFNPRIRTRSTSDVAGRFEFHNLVPGLYSLSVRIANYSPLLRSGIEVLAGKISDLNLILENLFQQALGNGSSRAEDVPVQEEIESVLRTVSSTRPILRVFESDEEKPPVMAVSLEADGRTYRKPNDFQGVVNVYTTAYSTDPDLLNIGGTFTQFALAKGINPRMGWVVAGVASDTGFAEVDSVLRVKDLNGHNSSVRVSFGQLPVSPGLSSDLPKLGQRLNLFNLDVQDEVQVTSSLVVAYGAEFQGTNPAIDARRFRPRMMVGFQPFRHHRFTLIRTSSLPRTERSLSLPEGEAIVFSSPFQYESGNRLNLGTSHVAHSELSSESTSSANSRLYVAAYTDSFSPALGHFWGQAAPDHRPSNRGVRVAYHRALGSRFDGTFGYTYGGGIRQVPCIASYSADNFHVLVARVSGDFPSSKTTVTTTYRWVSGYSLTGIDPYQEVFESSAPGMSVMVTQLIPYFGKYIPGRLEAQVDVRTLFTRSNPEFYSMATLRRLEFLQPPKSVRGGIQLKF